MELQFHEADLEFRAEVREFIDIYWPEEARSPRNMASHYPAERSTFERAWFDGLVARGWSVPHWPVEFGGTGWSATQKFIWDRETAVRETPLMSAFGVTMLGPVLYTWGSSAQKERFLPPIREARVQWCQGYSEPGAGSDLAALNTTAVRDGGRYLVNGTKTWTSGAHVADWMFCLVKTDGEAERPQQGISFLLIDMGSPGIEVRPIKTLGDHHSVNTVTLTDVIVPVDNRVGEENAGWTYAKALLAHERTGVARVAMSRVQLKRLKQVAGVTGQNGGNLAEDGSFQQKVHALEIDLLGLEMLELRTLAAIESGATPGPESSILKLKGTEIGQRIGELAVEVSGYYALPFPDPRLLDNEGNIGPDFALSALQGMLFSRSWSIYGGANEIQKNVIAKSVLGL